MSAPINEIVEDFETSLKANKRRGVELREEWLAMEATASSVRRVYFANALGDDAIARVVTVLRKFAPMITKYVGAGAGGAALTSILANSDGTGGIVGVLKGLLVLPGLAG